MPENTGIKNRTDYLQRLFEEDEKIAKKDKAYRGYLDALKNLVKLTDEIYDKKNGQLDKDSYKNLVDQYLEVAKKSNEFKEKGKSKARLNVVDYIQKVISKDLKALNTMDKNNPGTLDKAFETSRAAKVEVPQDLSYRVGGQMSDRFPIKNGDKKGFFTARTDTAKDEKWNELIDLIKELKLDKSQMKKIEKLRTDHKLRIHLGDVAIGVRQIGGTDSDMRNYFAVELGICKDEVKANEFLNKNSNIRAAMELLVSEGVKYLNPYNMVDRLGYDPYTRNDNKNAAMYEVAKMLGCEKVIAKAVPMVVVNGQKVIKGTFMEHVEGSDISNLKAGDPLLDYDPNESEFEEGLFRDLADIQALDYICGNIDRHKGNMIYKTEKGENGKVKLTGVVGIDNDSSFPEEKIDDREFNLANSRRSNRIFRPSNFRFMNKNTANIIKNLKREELETILRGHNLSKKAIDLAWKRTMDVKKAIAQKGPQSKMHYIDDLSQNKSFSTDLFDERYNHQKKVSIFSGFHKYLKIRIDHERKMLKKETNETQIAEYRGTTRESAFLAESLKIDGMDALMDRVNRLKTPTEEFVKMRDAVSELKKKYLEIEGKIAEGTKVEATDYQDYKVCLDTLNKAAKFYIQKKGITPKTSKGLERQAAALSIENRVEELIRNFEVDKKLDTAKVKEENIPEKEQNDNIELN